MTTTRDQAKLWRIDYTTPAGSHKHVLWHGPSAAWVESQWLAIAAPGTAITATEPWAPGRGRR